MDVFSLRDTVVDEYKNFATSFTTIFAEDIRKQVEAIYAGDRYWPEPLIQINPNFQPGRSLAELVAAGMLERGCADIFRMPPTKAMPEGEPLSLHKHQEQAIAIAGQGTSSGRGSWTTGRENAPSRASQSLSCSVPATSNLGPHARPTPSGSTYSMACFSLRT